MTQESSKVAIVTGASRGIGAAVAERLARDGFTVVINYSSDAAPAEALARKIEDKGGRALTAKADVSDPQAVRGMFDAAEAAFGGVDVLVNNAGIMALSPIAVTDDAAFERQVNVNLKGTFNALREAAKRLRDGGRIINFSSSVVGLLQPTNGVYAAAKAASSWRDHLKESPDYPAGRRKHLIIEGIHVMKQVIVITGASSDFGALAARARAHAGHTVYATMRETTGRNAPQVAEVERYAAEHHVNLRTVELDGGRQPHQGRREPAARG